MKKLLLLNFCIFFGITTIGMQQDPFALISNPEKSKTINIYRTLIKHIRCEDWYTTLRTFRAISRTNKHFHIVLSEPSIFKQIILQLAGQAAYKDEIDIAEGMRRMPGFSHPEFQSWFMVRKNQIILERELFDAAKNNNAARITYLLETKKVAINARNKTGKTALSIAASFGTNDALRELLRYNPAINLANKDGWTPLKKAANADHYESVKLLLEAGANVDQEDNEGYTPLMNAYNKPRIAQLLIEWKANVNHQAFDRSTTLLWAATDGQIEVIKVLLEAGAQDTYTNKNGHNALTLTTLTSESSRHAKAAQLLMTYGSKLQSFEERTAFLRPKTSQSQP